MSANPYLDLLQSEEQRVQESDGASIAATGSAPAKGNPYLDMLQSDEAQVKTQRKAALRLAVPVNPDEAAEAARLSKKYAVPDDVMLRNLRDVQMQEAVDIADDRLLTSPKLADRMLELSFARKAHDDVPTLAELEERIAKYGALKATTGPEATFGNVLLGLATALPQAGESIRQGINLEFADAFGTPESVQRAQRGVAAAQTARALTTPDFDTATARGLYGGADSLIRMLPGLAASIATRSPTPALAAAGVQTQTEAYGKYRARGADPFPALVASAGEGAVEVGTEMLPMGFIVERFGKVGAGEFLKGLLGREAPTEQVATFLQDAIDTAVANPDKTWTEFLAERPGAAYETLLATIVQSGAIGGANTIAQKLEQRQNKADAALAQGEALAGILQAAGQSKLRERDPEAFADFVQQAADADQQDALASSVYVDGLAFGEALAQLPPEEQEKIAAAMPKAIEALGEAVATGGDVSIPMGEFTTLAGTPLEQSITPLVRSEPGAWSQAEAQEFADSQSKLLEQEAEAVLQRIQATAEAQQQMQAVQDDLKAQLEQTKRFTSDVNQAYATLASSLYATMADRLGTTAQAVYAQFPLRIQAQDVAGEALAQARTLDAIRAAWDAAGIKHAVSEKAGEIELSQIIAPERGQGIGAAAMQQLIDYADATGQRVVLTPSSDFGGTKSRLVKFYKRFGFVENKGRNKGFTTRAGMIREPAPKPDAAVLNKDDRRGAFHPDSRTITLLKNADLSTFLHELGHAQLEMMAHIAAQPNAPAPVVADMQALLDWVGFEGTVQEWLAQSLDTRRDAHEQFARGFEAYLFEGKSPNIEIHGLFQRFRAWLVQVYKSLKALNVELSDEVRAVMDRMVATDAQIAEAQQAAGYMPMFETAEAAGMTPAQFVAYQNMGLGATNDAAERLQEKSLAEMKWLTNAKGRRLRELQREARDKREAVRDEVTAEVDAQPIEQARAYLKTLDAADPAVLASMKEWQAKRDEQAKATREDVKAEYLASEPELKGLKKGQFLAKNKRAIDNDTERLMLQWERDNPKPTRPKSAIELDIIAPKFGFTSGDHLGRELIEAPQRGDLIEAMTQQRILERHGELTDPQAMERAAEAAVHNEARGRFIAAELKAVEGMMNAREETGKTVKTKRGTVQQTVNVYARAAKQFAQEAMAAKRIRDIRPAQYTSAEARASKAAAEALAKGDTLGAATAKRNHLVNHYAAREATAALVEVEKAVAYLAKFNSEGTRKALDHEYVDQIDAILEQFDLRRGQSLKAIDKRKSLAEWVESQRALGFEPTVDPAAIEAAQRTHYRDLPLEQFRGVVDTVRNIEHLGRLKQKLLTAKDKREFDAEVARAAASIIAHGGKAKDVPLEPKGGVMPWLEGFWAQHRKISSLVRQMDGFDDNGPLYELLVRPMNEAGTREEVMIEQATVRLADIYKPVMALPGGSTGDMRYIPEIKNSLSRGGRLSIALNWGNAQNRQRIMDGDQWSEQQVRAILATLSPVELKFVNDVWEFIDSYWPEVKAKQLRVSGIVEDKVEAEPFDTVASDGTVVRMRGGYYPLAYDADRSSRAESQQAAEVAKDMMRGAFTRATTRRGHTKARVEEVNRAVRKDLGVITQHVTQVTHDLAWHEWIIDANRLLSAKPIDSAIREHYGPAVVRTLKDGLQGIATADVVPQTKIDNALLAIRSNISRSVMGLSMTTALLQPFGLTQSMVRIGPKHVLRGAARWAGDAARLESSMTWINEKSDFMRLRSKTFNREIREISQRVRGKSKAMQVVDGGLFWFMRKMQAVADVPTWIGQYEKSLAEGTDEATAIAAADRAVIEAQGGGQIKDMAEVQRKHPMLTQFYSYFSVTLNLTVESTARTNFKNPRAVAGWLGDMALLVTIPAILPSLIIELLRGGGEDDDAEDWAKKLLRWQAGYMLGMVVGAREGSSLVSGFDYSGPPVGRIIADLGKFAHQVGQGEIDEPAVMSTIRLAGSALGIPSVQAIRSWKGWKAWDEGDAPPTSILLGPPPKD